jgi:hypothetical protein
MLGDDKLHRSRFKLHYSTFFSTQVDIFMKNELLPSEAPGMMGGVVPTIPIVKKNSDQAIQ